jgi:peroxiredoxin Q/BCP
MTDTKLKIGDAAPGFTLKSDAGQTVRLSDYRGRRVIVYFYPKDDTPG